MKKKHLPKTGEYHTFYSDYIRQAGEGGILETLMNGQKEMNAFLDSLPDNKWNYRYAEGKWSLNEVLMHLMDSERVFAYRALCIARGDKTPLPGFDQDAYSREINPDMVSEGTVVFAYNAVRSSSLALFMDMPDKVLKRMGNANDSDISVRAIAYIIAGHEQHHLKVLKERYWEG